MKCRIFFCFSTFHRGGKLDVLLFSGILEGTFTEFGYCHPWRLPKFPKHVYGILLPKRMWRKVTGNPPLILIIMNFSALLVSSISPHILCLWRCWADPRYMWCFQSGIRSWSNHFFSNFNCSVNIFRSRMVLAICTCDMTW